MQLTKRSRNVADGFAKPVWLRTFRASNPADDGAEQQPRPQHRHPLASKGYCTGNLVPDNAEYRVETRLYSGAGSHKPWPLLCRRQQDNMHQDPAVETRKGDVFKVLDSCCKVEKVTHLRSA